MFLAILAVIAVCLLICRAFDSIELALLAGLLFPAFVQFRIYHDPLVGFGGFVPGVVLLNFTAMLLLDALLRPQARTLPLSFAYAIVFLLAVWSYEISIALAPIHGLIAWKRQGLRSKQFLISFLIVLVIALVSALLPRLGRSVAYAGTQVGSPGLFGRTLFLQLLGVAPFSFTWAAPAAVRDARPDLGIVAFFFAISRLVLWLAPRSSSGLPRGLILFGFLLFAAPGLPVAVSSKYQGELSLGLAYLPVFVSSLGAMVMGAGLLQACRKSEAASWALAGVIAIVASFAYAENAVVCRILAEAFSEPRSFESRALARGVLDRVPVEAGLVVGSQPRLDSLQPGWNWYDWNRPAFFTMHSAARPRFVVVESVAHMTGLIDEAATSQWWQSVNHSELWFFASSAEHKTAWSVQIERNSDGLYQTLGEARIYTEQQANSAVWEITPLVVPPGTDPNKVLVQVKNSQ